jgi:GTP diphosphokinase / guanosine-3',5'-bis(diphosphate) 3'-diphosphatase
MSLELTGPPREWLELSRLHRAMMLAADAHVHQVDKAGEPYLWHVFRVGVSLLPDIDAAVLGVLHDVREDSNTSEEDIKAALCGRLDLYPFLGTLTHHPGDLYLNYVRDCARHGITRKVKIADVADNMDPRRLRLAFPDDNDPRRIKLLEKYIPAMRILLDAERQPGIISIA